jgi:hypothetical protein
MNNKTTYTKEEQAANRKLLADALESGRFKQGEKFLCQKVDGNQLYCCLGVACELAMENGVRLVKEEYDAYMNVFYYSGSNGQRITGVLPCEVKKWLGFTDNNGMFTNPLLDDQKMSLVDANDSGSSFLEIAKMIREGKVRLEQ